MTAQSKSKNLGFHPKNYSFLIRYRYRWPISRYFTSNECNYSACLFVVLCILTKQSILPRMLSQRTLKHSTAMDPDASIMVINIVGFVTDALWVLGTV